MTSPGLDITQLLANLRKKSLESQGTPPDQDKPPMDQNKLMSIIAGGGNQSPIPPPQPAGGLPGAPSNPMQQIAGGDLGARPIGPATQQFQQMIPQEPMKSDPRFQPSGKRKFGAVLAGIGSGILNRNVGPAMDAYRAVRDEPYRKAEGDFKQKLINLSKSSDVEQAIDEEQRKEALKGAQVGELGERRKAETARAEAEVARRKGIEYKESPEYTESQRKFELEKERIAHPDKAEKPTTFNPFEEAIRARANELGVSPEQLPYSEVIKVNKDLEDQKLKTKTPDIETRWADAFEKEHGRPPNSTEIANFHRQPKDTSEAELTARNRRLDTTVTRLRKPYDKMFSDSSGQLDRINEASGMLTGPTAESGALASIKVITALVSGQGTGVRVTAKEIDTVAKARGFKGDIDSWLQGIQGQTKFTPQQVQELQLVLGAVRDLVTKKQKVIDSGIDNIEGASSPEEASKAESKLRKDLMGLSDVTQQSGDNKIRVRRKSDGQTGNLLEKDFDPAKYDRI